MPRNNIAAIIGLLVVFMYYVAGPGRAQGLPRSPRALGAAAIVFLFAFAITWIALRLLGY